MPLKPSSPPRTQTKKDTISQRDTITKYSHSLCQFERDIQNKISINDPTSPY